GHGDAARRINPPATAQGGLLLGFPADGLSLGAERLRSLGTVRERDSDSPGLPAPVNGHPWVLSTSERSVTRYGITRSSIDAPQRTVRRPERPTHLAASAHAS